MTNKEPVLDLDRITVIRNGNRLLSEVTLQVMPGEHWIVLGPNGCGKSTLLGVASLDLHASEGIARLLGSELGRTDIRPLRGLVGVSSASLATRLRGELPGQTVVVCGRYGALEPWWHEYTDRDRDRADELIASVGLSTRAIDQPFSSMSSGERQRVLLARALFNDPALLLLDEPNAGLDPGAREALIDVQQNLARNQPDRASILVTHHVEDIPASATHLLALRNASVVASGPIDQLLSGELVSELFDVDYELDHRNDRWLARPRRS